MPNPTSPTFPKLVMIIRHGEKPGAPDDDTTPSPDLSFRGSARAAALPSLFSPDPSGSGAPAQQMSCLVAAGGSLQFSGTYNSPVSIEAPASRFPTPQHIVASKTSSNSNRPVETVTPTSQALGHPVHADYKDDDYVNAANYIMSNYAGDVVLVCWHHGKIPELTGAFGVTQGQIAQALGGAPKWPGSTFDWIWSIDWATGSANLKSGYQHLLFGDQ